MLSRLSDDQRASLVGTFTVVFQLIPKRSQAAIASVIDLVLDYIDGLWRDDIVRQREEARREGFHQGWKGAIARAQTVILAHQDAHLQRIADQANHETREDEAREDETGTMLRALLETPPTVQH